MSRRVTPHSPAPLALALAIALTLGGAAQALTSLGVVDTPGSAQDAAVVGSTLYVADGPAGLRIYDVANPASPVPLGSSSAAANATRVVVGNGAAFVKDGTSGIRVIDVSNPAAPTLLGTIPVVTFSTLWEIALSGNRLYLSAFAQGVRAFDVSNPAAPIALGAYTGVLNGARIEVVGDRVFVTNGLSGAGRIADFSNPLAPLDLGGILSPGLDVAVSAGRAFVAGTSFLTVDDVSNPAAVKQIYANQSLAGTTRIEAAGRMLYLTDGANVRIYDASALPTSVPAAEVDLLNVRPNAVRALDQVRVGSLVYVGVNSNTAGLGSALAVVDVSDPDAPALLGSVALPGDVSGLDFAAGRIYATLDYAGLAIIDVSTPATPHVLGSIDTPGRAFDVSVTGNLACVADTDAMRIVDVSNPAAPVIVGTLPSLGASYDVQAVGTLAYVTEYGGVRVVSLANPAAPLPIASLPAPFANHVDVAGPYAYVLAGGLYVYDVSSPASPVQRFASAGISGRDSQIVGQRLWVRDFDVLTEYAIGNPILPSFVRSFELPIGTGSAIVSGDQVTATTAIAQTSTALAMLDLRNPGYYPYQVNAVATPAGATALVPVPSANRLYVAQSAAGVEIFDIAADLANRDCSDGVDDDGDGRVDFPSDPGCANAYLSAIENPACNDGLDNDGDTFVDLADPQCTSASRASEAPSPPAGCGLLGAEALVGLAALRGAARRRRTKG